MGDLGTSKKNQQDTTNQQVGVQGTGANGASGTIGKGAAQAVGGGISLVFNTGNNKISSKDAVGSAAGKAGNRGKAKGKNAATDPETATATPSASNGGGSNSASNQAGGNIAVQISQTDQGSVQAGAAVSQAALDLAKHANDALLQSNTNATTLAALALQAGEDVAAVAIPTYAANAIVDRPADLAAIDAQPQPVSKPDNTKQILLALSAVGLVLTLSTFAKGKP